MSDDQTIDKLVMDFVLGPFFPHHTGTPEATTLLHALATRAYNKGKAERDQARADARVLAAEVRAWREADHDQLLTDVLLDCDVESLTQHYALSDRRKLTDASGALERNKP